MGQVKVVHYADEAWHGLGLLVGSSYWYLLKVLGYLAVVLAILSIGVVLVLLGQCGSGPVVVIVHLV